MEPKIPISTWRTAHKKLLHEDEQYRKRFYSYRVTVVCLSCVLLVFYLPFFGIHFFGFGINLSIMLGIVAVIIYLTLRQISFEKQSIKRYLQSSHNP